MLGIWGADSHLESCAVQLTVVCDRQNTLALVQVIRLRM
jgi:hypothetical protein